MKRETEREKEQKSASWVKGHAHMNLQHVPDQFVSDFIKIISLKREYWKLKSIALLLVRCT